MKSPGALTSSPQVNRATGPEWSLIAMLTLVAALNYCDRTALSAVLPLLRSEFNVSDVWLGGLGSVFLWAYALASPFAGWLADTTRRTRVIVYSLFAWSLITLATGLVRDASQLMATRLLLGFAECAYLPAAVGLLGDRHQRQHRATAMGLHTAGLSIGTIAGATAAGYLGERFGWRSTFVLLGLGGMILSVILARAIHGKDVPVTKAAEGLEAGRRTRVVLKSRSYRILLAQSMVISIGIWLFLNWLPLYFKESFGMSLAVAGFSGTALLQAPGVIGSVAGGYLSDRVARARSSRRMLLQSVCYFIGGPVLLLFAFRPTLALVVAAIVLFSLCRSVAVSNEQPILCDLFPPYMRSTAVAFMNTANCIAGGIGVFAGGYYKGDYGLNTVFASICAIVLAAAVITAVGYRWILPRDLNRTTPERSILS